MKAYSLSNYPNPFNPTTVISYSIPNAGLVAITVYDALGREVETLVNEYKAAGNYQVNFDGSRLPAASISTDWYLAAISSRRKCCW